MPPVLASRVGLLGSGKSQKNDPNDARSIAIAALGSDRLRVVEPDDHVVVKTLHGSRSEATTPPTTPRPRSKWHLGGNTRHRLNLRGTRILNHAIHIAAVTQLRHDTNGRVCYQKKIAEGKTPRQLTGAGPGGHPGATLSPARPVCILNMLFGQVTSRPRPTLRPSAAQSRRFAQTRPPPPRKHPLDTKRLRYV